MCGITGWIDWERDLTQQKHILQAMTKTLTNRGPDTEGTWVSCRAALGHRRLIVVDPAGGAQPMVRNRGESTFVLTYNGELYNTEDIRCELAARGYSFRGHSDTEVLLLSYIEWGESCVDRFNGIYAFAVWEEANEKLFMARDRMGVKPLFYTQRGSAFLYGSELKALLAHPYVEPVVDREGLAEVLALGPNRTPGHGVFKGIREVQPGYCLTLDRSGIRERQYWKLESKPHEDDFETTTNKVRELVLDAFYRQLVSDVPVCTFLSGGLDSSAITAFTANYFKEKNKGPLHTFSVDFEGNAKHFKASHFQPNSDAQWIGRMSDYFNTEHHYVDLSTTDLADSLIPAVLARDLPGMADVDSSLYLFCKEVKKSATVALSGECADEVFGGYPWYHDQDALDSDIFPWMRSMRIRSQVYTQELRDTIRPLEYVTRRYRETLEKVPRLAGEAPEEARRREMFHLNFWWFMQNLLDRKDRMSMATGLEVRVPFCDHRIVEYVWNIPWEMKMWEGREKGILRRALRGLLPDDVLFRKKSPYPKTHNPAYLAIMKERLTEVINDSTAPLLEFIDLRVVRNLLAQEGDVFDKPWFGQLMTGPQLFAFLIQVNTWLKEYKVRIC